MKLLCESKGINKSIDVCMIKGKPCMNLGQGIFPTGYGFLKKLETRDGHLIGYGIDDNLIVPVEDIITNEYLELDESKEPVHMKLDNGKYEETIEAFPSLVNLLDNPKLKNIYKESLDAVEGELRKGEGITPYSGGIFPYSEGITPYAKGMQFSMGITPYSGGIFPSDSSGEGYSIDGNGIKKSKGIYPYKFSRGMNRGKGFSKKPKKQTPGVDVY